MHHPFNAHKQPHKHNYAFLNKYAKQADDILLSHQFSQVLSQFVAKPKHWYNKGKMILATNMWRKWKSSLNVHTREIFNDKSDSAALLWLWQLPDQKPQHVD